jgi:hypothetical protein
MTNKQEKFSDDLLKSEQEDQIQNDEINLLLQEAREDLLSYAMLMDSTYEPNWHHELIAEQLTLVKEKKLKRLIIQMPPRSGKSRLISEIFPSWYLGHKWNDEIMLASYAEHLSKDFSGKARDLCKEALYSAVFNLEVRKDKTNKGDWALNRSRHGKGAMRAVGLNGSITGRGADVFIVDDPIRNRKDADSKLIRDTIWNNYRSAVNTRLQEDSAIIIVLTTWHLDDLIGRIKTNLAEHDIALEDDWKVIKLSAIADEDEEWEIGNKKVVRKAGEPLWPDRFSKEYLLSIKKEIGVVEFSSLYQQNPVSSETQVFHPELFQYRTEEDLAGKECQRFLSVDPSVGSGDRSDYTGFVDNRIDKENFWNVMAWHKRIGPKELIDVLFALHLQNHYDRIGIEETMYEMAIRPFLQQEMIRRNMFLPLVQLKHLQRSKISRIGDLESRYEAGRIFHLKHMCKDLEEELLTYPRGIHDDIADALAYQIQLTEDSYEGGSGGDFPETNLFTKDGFY